MTEIADDIKTEMVELVATYGDTITIYTRSSTSYNDRGDETITYSAGTAAKGVMITSNNEMVLSDEGNLLRGGSLKMFIKATETVDTGDKVTHKSIDYDVTNIEIKSVEDTIMYYVLYLTKQNSAA